MVSSTQNQIFGSIQDIIAPVDVASSIWKTANEPIHSLHHLCSRVCSFPPAMPRFFIRQYSQVGDVVFDAWSGRGTVPLEALLNNRVGIGNDLSPEAFVLTKAKVQPVDFNSLNVFLQKLEEEVKIHELTKKLDELDRKAAIFYSKKTFQQLLALKEVLASHDSIEANFTRALVLGILHGKPSSALSLRCSHSYSMSPKYVKNYAKEHGLRRPSKKIFQEIRARAKSVLRDPLPLLRGTAFCDDSRKLSLPDESVDLIFSSPPYFNVQTYAWCNWLRLWFLGYDYRLVKKSLCESGCEETYMKFMRESLSELYRVLKADKRCFIVAGDVKLGRANKRVINTIEFLTPLFEESGFTLEKVITENIPANKRVLTYIDGTQGVKTERIALLTK